VPLLAHGFLDGCVGCLLLSMPAGDQLGMQMPSRWFEGQLNQFIDEQQFRLAAVLQPHLQRPLLVRLEHGAKQFHSRGELHRVATGHRLTALRHRQVARSLILPGSNRGSRLELKALQRAHERETLHGQPLRGSQGLRHRQPTLLLARHLSRAEPGKGLPQVELPPGSSLTRRSIERN